MTDAEAHKIWLSLMHPHATKHHIDRAINHENDDVRWAVFHNEEHGKEHIQRGLQDKQWFVREAAQALSKKVGK